MTANPLDGPFMTGRQMTDYSDQPGYAIRLGHVPEGTDVAAGALARLDGRQQLLKAEADR